jgi:two-component system sensor histidine kinase BarA
MAAYRSLGWWHRLRRVVGLTRNTSTDLASQIDFLTAISPQLRTPLNDIIGYAEYIYHNASEPMIRFPSQIIFESGNQLLGLVNASLDWSQLASGQVVSTPTEFSLSQWLLEMLALHRAQASALDVHLIPQPHPDLPPAVWLDRGHLSKVMQQLLHNAIKFSREGGEVKVVIEYRAPFHSLVFSVQDAGVGIALDKHASVFQRFWQDEDYIRTPYAGAGLGLALAKKWVEFMGGEIGFNSSPNVGSIFFFSLPLTDGKAPTL